MRLPYQLFVIAALFSSTIYAADDAFLFQATVHGAEANAIPVEVSLSNSSTRQVDIGEGLVVEFTAPNGKTDGEQTMVRLLRKNGDGFKVLHTARQGLMDGSPRQNAYLVCGERVTFMSPPVIPPPECSV